MNFCQFNLFLLCTLPHIVWVNTAQTQHWVTIRSKTSVFSSVGVIIFKKVKSCARSITCYKGSVLATAFPPVALCFADWK